MIRFTPGKPPYAASALIFHHNGLVLSVSRKHDPNDLGLPGGKLDPGENFEDACIREVKEETGLEIIKLKPLFGDYCGTPGIHNVHWCLTYLCKAQGTVQTREKGRVLWIPRDRLIKDEHGKFNSFGDYNQDVFRLLDQEKVNIQPFLSYINVEEKHILRLPWDDSGKLIP